METLPKPPETESEKKLEADEFVTRVLQTLEFLETRKKVEGPLTELFGAPVHIMDISRAEGGKINILVDVPGQGEQKVSMKIHE